MQRFSTAPAILMLAVCVRCATAQEPQAPDTLFHNDVSDLAKSMEVPGASWALVLDGHASLGAYGVADRSTDQPVDPVETVFRIASVSKVFTAAAISQLVADDQLDLDQDLRAMWPWLSGRLGNEGPISLRQLLTHTSGLDDRVMGMFCPKVGDVRPLGEYLRTSLPLRTTPAGQSTRYSNHGFALAGLAVEESTGQSFADAVRTLVFEPLDMTSSSFAQPLPGSLSARLARAYSKRDVEPIPLDWRNTPPAGGMVTSAEDMSRFLQELVTVDGRLGASAKDLLTRQHFTAHPEVPGLALALQEQRVSGRRALVHAGGSSGYRSLFVAVPKSGAGLFLVATGGDGDFGAKVLARFSEELGESPEPAEPAVNPAPVSVDACEAYAGCYLLGRAPCATIERFPALFLFNHYLMSDERGYLVRREGGGLVRYGRIAEDLFQAVDGSERLVFQRDSAGNILAMHASDPFFGARFPATYHRLPWWSEPLVMNELLSWTLGLPMLALFGWLGLKVGIGGYRKLRRGRQVGDAAVHRPSWGTFGLCAILVATMGVFGFGFMARLNGLARSAPELLAYGLPPEMARLLWIPHLTAILTIVVFAACLLAWTRRRPITDRLLLTVTSLATFGFLVLLVHFRMLPPVP